MIQCLDHSFLSLLIHSLLAIIQTNIPF
jgi:hypothetical protein